MRALQTWVPPGWLNPFTAFCLMAGLFFGAGKIYPWSLAVIWPLSGMLAIFVNASTGEWNYDDTFGQQAMLGFMHLAVPPIMAAFLISDLRDSKNQRQLISQDESGDLADEGIRAIAVTIGGIIAGAVCLSAIALLAYILTHPK